MTAVRGRFLTLEEVADRLRSSPRTVTDLIARREIPHRRLPGMRRVLFRPEELAAWEDGAALEVLELERGGRIVRPVADA